MDCTGENNFLQASPPSNAFSSISAGGSHTCGVLAVATGSSGGGAPALCFGLNTNGQASPPSGVDFRPRSLSCGLSHSCGLQQADGAPVCWGANYYGQVRVGGGGGAVDADALAGEPAPGIHFSGA